MNPIATDNGRFKDGNPATGEYGTVVTAEHMNNVQDSVISMQNEIITVLNEAGIEVDPNDNTQLWQALQMIAGQVESIADLRQFEPVRDRQVAFVKGYYAGGNKGGGYFIADLTDTQTADNAGTVIVTEGGARWKRVYSVLSPHDLGETEYQEDEVAFTHGITRIFGGGKLPKNYKKRVDGFNVEESVVAIGRGALANATSAGQTIAIGGNALGKAIASYSNIAIGETALENLQSSGSVYNQGHQGSRNIAIGGNAMQFLETGTGNIAIGRNTACGMSSASECVIIGSGAMSGLNVNGWMREVESQLGNKNANAKVTAVGAEAMQYFNGSQAVAFGYKSGKNIKIGNGNTLIGHQAGMNLENLVGWDGFVKTAYGENNQGLSVDYVKNGNQVELTLNGHSAEVGSTVFVRWDSGPALPQPLHGHPWRQVVTKTTTNTFTVTCPYNGDGGGRATVYWSLSKQKESADNTSYHNTFLGHHAAVFADKSIGSTVLGSMHAQGENASIVNSTVIGYRNLGKAKIVNNAIVIGHNLMANDEVVENVLNIGGGFYGDLSLGKYSINVVTPLADMHIGTKKDAGSGASGKKEGLLVDHSLIAKVNISGGAGANLDMYQGDTLKGGLRYSYSQGFMTVVMNGESSWRFFDDHTLSPTRDKVNGLGKPNLKVKEIYVDTPDLSETGDKAITAKWFNSQFASKFGQNGWSKLPNGEIEQWGVIAMEEGDNRVTVNFPIAFNECFFVVPIDISSTGNVVAMSVGDVTNTTAVIQGNKFAGTLKWFAKGR